jgi:serine O-acetyltransferase
MLMANTDLESAAQQQDVLGRGLSVGAHTSTAPANSLASVVEALCSRCGEPGSVLRGPGLTALPSRELVIQLVEQLRAVLFPGYMGTSKLTDQSMRFHLGAALNGVLGALQEQVRRGLCFACEKDLGEHCHECDEKARGISHAFIAQPPWVQRLLVGDALAAFEGDPAAIHTDEAIFCYPGLMALTNQRLAHELQRLEVPLLPRMITEHAHSLTGIDIHPGATIGEKLFIDHGTGVVIGETAEIGNRVRIYQGVTLGAQSFPLDENGNRIKGIPRHPIVEDDVVIYAGATVLGRIRIGRGSVVGGNVWLTRDVPPRSQVSQVGIRRRDHEGTDAC